MKFIPIEIFCLSEQPQTLLVKSTTQDHVVVTEMNKPVVTRTSCEETLLEGQKVDAGKKCIEMCRMDPFFAIFR